MTRALGWIRGLAWLTAALGVVSLFWLMRDPELLASSVIPAFTRAAFGSLWTWVFVAVAVAAPRAARWADERPSARLFRGPSGARKVEVKARVDSTSGDDATASVLPGPPLRAPGVPDDVKERIERDLRPDADIDLLVDDLLVGALEAGATEVRIQPGTFENVVSFRLDHILYPAVTIPRLFHSRIVDRFAELAELSEEPSENRSRFGHFTLGVADSDEEIAALLSIRPRPDGDEVLVRLGGDGPTPPRLEELGMPGVVLERYRELLDSGSGLFLLTGPPGVGKRTTLYASLHRIHRQRGEDVRISTLEEIVEMRLPFLHQTSQPSYMPTVEALEALAEESDVIMVGAIRDSATVKAICRLVRDEGKTILATARGQRAGDAFPQLLALGAEPYALADATRVAMSQRLVPKLCEHCRRELVPSRAQRERLGALGVEPGDYTFHRADGCPACERTGERGVTGVFELIEMTPALERLVRSRSDARRVEQAAWTADRPALERAAILAAAEGRIRLDDALALGDLPGVTS